MGVGLIAWSVGLLFGLILGLRLRRRRSLPPPPPPSPAPRRSIAIELAEAPGSRPIRYCARCQKSVMKLHEGDMVWIRIEHEEIHYLHAKCADGRGDPLP